MNRKIYSESTLCLKNVVFVEKIMSRKNFRCASRACSIMLILSSFQTLMVDGADGHHGENVQRNVEEE